MDPAFTSHCMACRRRWRWNGQPVFTTCSCIKHGRSVTIAALAAGLSAVALGLLWRLQRPKR